MALAGGECYLASDRQSWASSNKPTSSLTLNEEALENPPETWLRVQLHQLFCIPKDCSPPVSSAHGISQARILEWVATSFSRGSS